MSELLNEIAGELVVVGLMIVFILAATFFPIEKDKTFDEIDNEIKSK